MQLFGGTPEPASSLRPSRCPVSEHHSKLVIMSEMENRSTNNTH